MILADGTVLQFVPITEELVQELPHYVPPSMVPPIPTNSMPYEYKAGIGDVLRVTVWDHPELNNPGLSQSSQGGAATAADIVTSSGSNDPLGRVVQPDGTIYFPYAGVIHVDGLPISQIRRILTERLAAYLQKPQLDVSVVSFRSQRAYISGEVARPGIIALNDVPVTIADVVNAAGGVTLTADMYHATLTRDGRQIPVDLYALLHDGALSQNFRIHAGDIFNIPDNRFNKVFVLGEVTKPGSMAIPKGDYTLAEAISDTGGVSQLTANAGHVYVIRRDVKTHANVYTLDASSPTAMMVADNFELMPRDLIFVDAAHISRFSRVLTQIAPFFSGAANAATSVR
ncbi:MAG: polysaccharide biosynthesis/export family protein [Janthinobacterium lividum]